MEAGYYKTKESVEEYVRLAKDVNGGLLIEDLKKVLIANSTILELGSGPGSDWEILCKSYKVIGSDNSTEFLNHLIANHPQGDFLLLDAVSIITDKKFDGIYANKVLHHLTNQELEKSILRQHKILNPKGIICHSFWKGEGSEVFKGLFVNYHDKEFLKKLYNPYFEVLSIEFYEEFEPEDSILLIAKKKN